MSILTFRITLLAAERGEHPATWTVYQQVSAEWQRTAVTPSFDTALVALFDSVPWTDATTFSHAEIEPGITEFTFHTQEQHR